MDSCTVRAVWNSRTQSLELCQDSAILPLRESQYSITFSEPALLLPRPQSAPKHTDRHADTHTPPNKQHSPDSKYAGSITFPASFRVPVGAPELVGWQEGGGGHVTVAEAQELVVLASSRSWCLPVTVTQQQVVGSNADGEERTMQVGIGCIDTCRMLVRALLHLSFTQASVYTQSSQCMHTSCKHVHLRSPAPPLFAVCHAGVHFSPPRTAHQQPQHEARAREQQHPSLQSQHSAAEQ